MRFAATPAAVLLLGGAVNTDGVGAVRVTHDVHLDASLFRSAIGTRPRIDLYAEHRKFQTSEVIGGEREVPLVPENVPLAWKMIGWILGGA